MASYTFSGKESFSISSEDIIHTRLSFALWLVDDYTKNKPIGKIRVKIQETDKEAIRNLDGYYIFMNLNLDSSSVNYTVRIESDLYLPEEMKVERSSVPDPKNPVIEISLKPRPEYPFSENATLVRGQVISGSDKLVEGIRVGVQKKDIETVTDSRGEFVLYFKDIAKTEQISLIINEETDEHSITAEEGRTISAKKISIS